MFIPRSSDKLVSLLAMAVVHGSADYFSPTANAAEETIDVGKVLTLTGRYARCGTRVHNG